jgi:hypothetical protein
MKSRTIKILIPSLVAFGTGAFLMLAARLLDWETFNFLSGWNAIMMVKIGASGGMAGLFGYWGHAGKVWLKKHSENNA